MSAILATNARARLDVLRDQSHPVGSKVDFYVDDGAGGGVDYDDPLNASPIDLWPPNGAGKTGYGRGRYGRGGYGRGEGGLGYGGGLYGRGGYGTGAALLQVGGAGGFLTAEKTDATWTFAAKISDPAGNESIATETAITLAGTPAAPTDLAADSYAAGVLTVSLTLSTDDN